MLKGLGVALERFTADGAYDTRAMYEAVGAIGAPSVKIVIPPKRTAVADPLAVGPWRQRNETQEWIARIARRQWRKESGAHRQARAESGMYRYKRVIGDSMRARTREAQTREARIAVNVLNRMTELGTPDSVAVVV